jgi:hypothetical protein
VRSKVEELRGEDLIVVRVFRVLIENVQDCLFPGPGDLGHFVLPVLLLVFKFNRAAAEVEQGKDEERDVPVCPAITVVIFHVQSLQLWQPRTQNT